MLCALYEPCHTCLLRSGMAFIKNRSKLPNYNTSPQQRRRDLLGDQHSDLLGSGSPTTAAAAYLNPTPPLAPSNSEDPLAGLLLGLSQMVTKMAIVHPCGVIRRQCQVHQHARYLHFTPLTLLPVTCNLISQHGVSTLWRGSVGSGVVWGMSSVIEIVMADLCGLPRTVVENSSYSKYWRHILLKATTSFLMTPFHISSFIETIRSGKGLIAADDNRLMEVITKGFGRMKYLIFGPRDHSRKLSVLHLAAPTVIFHTSHYIIHCFLYTRLHKVARDYLSRKPPSERTKLQELTPHLFATMTSTVLTDVILFPLETILHRLYVQGTRTLIDNMDSGILTISVKVKYDGFFHCLKTIMNTEGCWALYAGVGAVMLEYGLQSCLHQIIRACFERGSESMHRVMGGGGEARIAAGGGGGGMTREPSDRSLSPPPPLNNHVTMAAPSSRNSDAYPSFGELSASDPLTLFAAQSMKSPMYMHRDAGSFNHQFME